MEQADGLSRSGRPNHALPIYDRILAGYPRHAAAHRERGNALADLGHLGEAVASFERAIALDPRDADCFDYRGIALAQMGRMAEAADSLDRAVALNPDNANALGNRGIVLMHLGRLDDALASLDDAIARYPQHVAAYVNRGNLLLRMNRPDEALASHDRALAIDPANVDAHFNRGVALAQTGRLDAAVASYDRALALAPGRVDALNNRGIALAGLERFEEAFGSYRRALAVAPDHPPVLFNLAELLYQLGRVEDAERCYAAVLAGEPGHIQARFNRAVSLTDLHQLDAAVAEYRQLLALKPDSGEALNNCGIILRQLGHHQEALASFDKAVEAAPGSAEFWLNRGGLRSDLGDTEGALADCDRALALHPAVTGGLGRRLITAFGMCQWRDCDEQLAALKRQIASGLPAAEPGQLIALTDDPALQRTGAEIFRRARHAPMPATPVAPRYPRAERIRIGYFSADFFEHATMRLMAEMLEAHDHRRFELTGFSFGPDKQDGWTTRAAAAMDRFIDVRAMTDRQAAQLARSLEIDIAVDLKGFTKHDRSGIFAERAAPVQLSFLGYPGTSGMASIDYFIGDAVTLPAGSEPYFSEKLLRLPGSYQPNCRALAATPPPGGRDAMGLPADAMVYCCFNQRYKLTPAIFDRWLRVLRQVDGSVLWLWVDPQPARASLRGHAAEAGVDPGRIVFASALPSAQHLGRLPLADLFLDTYPCGAHTTASDALRTGLPLLTAPGAPFASRVAASLLYALDLPELVADGPDDYEARAVALGRDQATLAALRCKLAATVASSSLFDPVAFARKLERGFAEIYERCQAGLPPDHITIANGQ